MTTAKLEMDNGLSFDFGIQNGSTFLISPMSGLDITVNTAQGFQMAGVYVTSRDLGGVSRDISGAFIRNAPAKATKLIQTAVPMQTGRLIYNNAYYCNVEIERTPEILTQSALTTYEFTVFCPDPYWYSLEAEVGETSKYESHFEFPVLYDEHAFAVMGDEETLIVNDGDLDSIYSMRMNVLQTCSNIGIINVDTLEKFELDDDFEKGDTIEVAWKSGILTIVKNGTDNIFYALTEDSELFKMHTGGNMIKSYAAEGDHQVAVRITCNSTYAGIHRAVR